MCSQVSASAPPGDALLVVGHNGPTGLGARPYDMCGMDWVAAGGDHGDPDLEVGSGWASRAAGFTLPHWDGGRGLKCCQYQLRRNTHLAECPLTHIRNS